MNDPTVIARDTVNNLGDPQDDGFYAEHEADDFECMNCGHPPSWHRLDDSLNLSPTDPNTPFRCIGYDCTTGERAVACHVACPDFVDPPGYADWIAWRAAS